MFEPHVLYRWNILQQLRIESLIRAAIIAQSRRTPDVERFVFSYAEDAVEFYQSRVLSVDDLIRN